MSCSRMGERKDYISRQHMLTTSLTMMQTPQYNSVKIVTIAKDSGVKESSARGSLIKLQKKHQRSFPLTPFALAAW